MGAGWRIGQGQSDFLPSFKFTYVSDLFAINMYLYTASVCFSNRNIKATRGNKHGQMLALWTGTRTGSDANSGSVYDLPSLSPSLCWAWQRPCFSAPTPSPKSDRRYWAKGPANTQCTVYAFYTQTRSSASSLLAVSGWQGPQAAWWPRLGQGPASPCLVVTTILFPTTRWKVISAPQGWFRAERWRRENTDSAFWFGLASWGAPLRTMP